MSEMQSQKRTKGSATAKSSVSSCCATQGAKVILVAFYLSRDTSKIGSLYYNTFLWQKFLPYCDKLVPYSQHSIFFLTYESAQ
jgi:hypothetical protein